MELKTVNVTAQEHLRAWKESILPLLKELHDQNIIQSTALCPLLLQDDNAKPHRGSILGVCVTKLICDLASTKFGLHMKPLEPKQPAQSPDCNPLDTFYFRVMFKNFRQARAEDRVLRALEEGRHHVNDEVVMERKMEKMLKKLTWEMKVISFTAVQGNAFLYVAMSLSRVRRRNVLIV
jgi:hypothetical protein